MIPLQILSKSYKIAYNIQNSNEFAIKRDNK